MTARFLTLEQFIANLDSLAAVSGQVLVDDEELQRCFNALREGNVVQYKPPSIAMREQQLAGFLAMRAQFPEFATDLTIAADSPPT